MERKFKIVESSDCNYCKYKDTSACEDRPIGACLRQEEQKWLTVQEYENIVIGVSMKTLNKLSAYATDEEKSKIISKDICIELFKEVMTK